LLLHLLLLLEAMKQTADVDCDDISLCKQQSESDFRLIVSCVIVLSAL